SWSCAPPLRFGARSLLLDPLWVAGDVGLGVLHHDAVTGEGGSSKPALEDDRDPGLEQLGRVTRVADGHGDAVVLDGKGDVVRLLLHRAGHDRALDPETAIAEVGALGHRLVGGAEVKRGVAEAAHNEKSERGDDHDTGDPQTPVPGW